MEPRRRQQRGDYDKFTAGVIAELVMWQSYKHLLQFTAQLIRPANSMKVTFKPTEIYADYDWLVAMTSCQFRNPTRSVRSPNRNQTVSYQIHPICRSINLHSKLFWFPAKITDMASVSSHLRCFLCKTNAIIAVLGISPVVKLIYGSKIGRECWWRKDSLLKLSRFGVRWSATVADAIPCCFEYRKRFQWHCLVEGFVSLNQSRKRCSIGSFSACWVRLVLTVAFGLKSPSDYVLWVVEHGASAYGTWTCGITSNECSISMETKFAQIRDLNTAIITSV